MDPKEALVVMLRGSMGRGDGKQFNVLLRTLSRLSDMSLFKHYRDQPKIQSFDFIRDYYQIYLLRPLPSHPPSPRAALVGPSRFELRL